MKKLIFAVSSVSVFLSPFAVAASDASMHVGMNTNVNEQCLLKGQGAAVYAPMPDGSRRVFPNAHTWNTWYENGSSCIQTVTDDVLATMPLTGVITAKPGVSLLKIQSDPRVYAVEAPNRIRWIASEDAAKSLYGEQWQNKVVDIDESLLSSYQYGAPIVERANFNLATATATVRPWDVSSEDRPWLRIISRPTQETAELGLTVPRGAKVPTSIMDVSAKDEDRVALALCDINCSFTVHMFRPGTLQAWTWMGDMFHVSNKITLDPNESIATMVK